jgi:hypothetical protein
MQSKRRLVGIKWLYLLLGLALLAPAGCTPDRKAQEELRQEVKGLKTEVKALEEKIAKLEAGQQEMLKLLQKTQAPPPEAAAPAAPEVLSVAQLIKEKDRFLGTRVTVKGMPGTVLVHHKTLLLKGQGGMVEVYFGSLPDVKTINRLTSTTLEQPLTVTGVLNFPPRGGGNLRITAEAVEF